MRSRRVEHDLGAVEAEAAPPFGEVPVVADVHTDLADGGLEDRIAVGAGREIELLPEARARGGCAACGTCRDTCRRRRSRRRCCSTGRPAPSLRTSGARAPSRAPSRSSWNRWVVGPFGDLLGVARSTRASWTWQKYGPVEQLLEAHHLGALVRRPGGRPPRACRSSTPCHRSNRSAGARPSRCSPWGGQYPHVDKSVKGRRAPPDAAVHAPFTSDQPNTAAGSQPRTDPADPGRTSAASGHDHTSPPRRRCARAVQPPVDPRCRGTAQRRSISCGSGPELDIRSSTPAAPRDAARIAALEEGDVDLAIEMLDRRVAVTAGCPRPCDLRIHSVVQRRRR